MKIIFLDIDGPMIPRRNYIFNTRATLEHDLDPTCVKVLRAILDETGAKIVFNTTHSRFLHGNNKYPSLLKTFADRGFELGEDIHPDCKTDYPDFSRGEAIKMWLARNHADAWIALDDTAIDDERAFLTNADFGLGWDDYNHARLHLLGEKPKLVLL